MNLIIIKYINLVLYYFYKYWYYNYKNNMEVDFVFGNILIINLINIYYL